MTRFRVLPAGWLIALLVAVLAYVAKPEDELGFAVVVGGLAAGMALWTLRSDGRAPLVTSLVLGLLWTLLFGGYAVADLTGDEDVEPLTYLADPLAVVGGLLILGGAVDRLRRRRPDA